MRIGIDIDDTLFDFVGVWIAEYNKEHDDKVELEDITDWVFSGVDFKCTKVEFYNYLHNAYLQLRAKMFPNAFASLDKLATMGHLACFITATRRSVAPTKINKLLMELDPDLAYELHFTSEKAHVFCDAYIDDNPKDIEAYLAALPHGRLVMLYDRPWNRHVHANSVDNLVGRVRDVQHDTYQRRKLERLEMCQTPIRVTSWADIVTAIQWFDELLRVDPDPKQGSLTGLMMYADE
jgi:5'(3')-deoxyribonucleotidase